MIVFHVILQLFSRELSYHNEYDVVCPCHSHEDHQVWSEGRALSLFESISPELDI
jgi:hypothetical protein